MDMKGGGGNLERTLRLEEQSSQRYTYPLPFMITSVAVCRSYVRPRYLYSKIFGLTNHFDLDARLLRFS